MRAALPRARRGRTRTRRCVAAGLDGRAGRARRRSRAVVAAVQEGARRPRARADRELARGRRRARRSTRSCSTRPTSCIVGELVHRVSYCLVARRADRARRGPHGPLPSAGHRPVRALPGRAAPGRRGRRRGLDRRTRCARWPRAATLAGAPPHAAIGTRHAAALYGAAVLAEGDRGRRRERDPVRLDRARRTRRPRPPAAGRAPRVKTALVFWGGGDVAPGWLVDCLTEFASRAINLTRIESRPRRVGLGHYMFFCDLEGAAGEPRRRRRDRRAARAIARPCGCSAPSPPA